MPLVSMAGDLSIGRHPPTIAQTLSFLRSGVKPENTEQFGNYMNVFKFYHNALEDERQKIDAFKRELPFCIQLLDDAIGALREQLAHRLISTLGPSPHFSNKCLDDTNFLSRKPALEECILFKRKFEGHEGETEELKAKRSVQWTDTPGCTVVVGGENLELHWNSEIVKRTQQKDLSQDRCIKQYDTAKTENVEATPAIPKLLSRSKEKFKGAFTPFGKDGNLLPEGSMSEADIGSFPSTSKENLVNVCPVSRPSDSIDPQNPDAMLGTARNNSNGQSQRKARRCWSPELHQRFLNALQQLGGPQVATPKQIRELMNVEGLTNDEVKSHLQKFRLHIRRPSPAPQTEGQQGPHLVVFGGIWVPPEYGNPSEGSSQQALGLYDASMQKPASLIPSALLPQGFFSHMNSSSQLSLHATGYEEYRQRPSSSQHDLMQEQSRHRYSTSEEHDGCSEDCSGSENTGLNGRNKFDAKDHNTEIDLERATGGQKKQARQLDRDTNVLSKELHNETAAFTNGGPPRWNQSMQRDGKLQSFLGAPFRISCGSCTCQDGDNGEVQCSREGIEEGVRNCKLGQQPLEVRQEKRCNGVSLGGGGAALSERDDNKHAHTMIIHKSRETELCIGCPSSNASSSNNTLQDRTFDNT